MPAEIAHVLEEIRDKDIKFYETRKRIQQRDNQIHKFIRNHGSLAENPKESSYPKIRSDFEKAMALQQEKCDLANTGLYIVSKHLKKLTDEIKRLEKDGMISLSTDSPGISTPTASDRLSMGGRHQKLLSGTLSASAGGRKHGSPAPTSRGATPSALTGNGTPLNVEQSASTPSARPTKRQKLGVSGSSQNAGTSTPLGGGAHKTSSRPSVRLVSPGTGTPMTLKSNTPGESGYDGKGSAASTPRASSYSRKDNKSGATLDVGSPLGLEAAAVGMDGEDEIYCICRQVSFGNMIGCDNEDCKIEWFHYDCVGLTEPPDPKSLWFCPDCRKAREANKETKKRGRAAV